MAADKGEDVSETIKNVLDGSSDNGSGGITNEAHRDAVQRYLRVRKSVDQVAGRTRLNDVQALLKLSTFLEGEREGLAFGDATAEDLMAWSDALTGAFDLAESTANLYRMHVKRFYKWLNNPKEYRRANTEVEAPEPVAWIRSSQKTGKRELASDELLNEEDVEAMLDVANHPRDKALIATLWDSGVRVQELINLEVRHFDPDAKGGVLFLKSGGHGQKTGDRRIRLVEATPYLVSFLNSHPLADCPGAPLFFTRNASDYSQAVREARGDAEDGVRVREETLERLRLTRSGVMGVVKRLADHANIVKNVTPHLFRHSRATWLAARDVNEAVLRQRFGWSRTSDTPSIYLHMAGAHTDEAILRACGKEPREEPEAALLEEQQCPFGHTNEPTARFCHECGTPLGQGDAAENPGAMGRRLLELLEDDGAAEELTMTLLRDFLENRDESRE